MSNNLSFTGERFLPECVGEIVYEHWHRYAFARRFAGGRRVLDMACGEGYGTALLARDAAFALGVDIAPNAIAHATLRYAQPGRCLFTTGSCCAVPAAAATFDLIVCFETIEHVDAQTQECIVSEFARLLAPGGIVLLSSPNKALYSDLPNYKNEFHVHELYRDELEKLVEERFPVQHWYAQKVQSLSMLWAEAPRSTGFEAWKLNGDLIEPYSGPPALYHVVALAKDSNDLPPDLPGLSVFVDQGESLQATHEAALRELLRLEAMQNEQRRRLEAMIAERDDSLAKRAEHIAHLERLNQDCQTVVVERDSQLVHCNTRAKRLEDLVLERERLIVERDQALAQRAAHIAHLEQLKQNCERVVIERDAMLADLAGLLSREQDEHANLVLSLRQASQAKIDLAATLSGLESEQEKLLQAVREFKDRLAEGEEKIRALRKMIAERDAVVLYRQSFRWWLMLPLARAKMALRIR